MTYQSDPQHPWIFHRDEVDLLEEDIEDIYRGYQEQPKTQTVVEDRVAEHHPSTETYVSTRRRHRIRRVRHHGRKRIYRWPGRRGA